MIELTREYIRKNLANSDITFQRGFKLYELGAFSCTEFNPEKGNFVYNVDGKFGDYTTQIKYSNDILKTSCNCPYPYDGCTHSVAVVLDLNDKLKRLKSASIKKDNKDNETKQNIINEPFLSAEEIKAQALEDRKKRAKAEEFKLTLGDMYKGEHLVANVTGRQYCVTLHDPEKGFGHCSCPDFISNQLGTCKHIIFLLQSIKSAKDFKARMQKELFPFVDIFWDSIHNMPRLFCERPEKEISDIKIHLGKYFDKEGLYTKKDLTEILPLLPLLDGHKAVRIQESVLQNIDESLMEQQLSELAKSRMPEVISQLKTKLYPYQDKGVQFGLYRKAALIGDEMGLGKTMQAIALGILKKEIFGFNRILIVTLASLKEQWKREIERFSDEKAVIVAGSSQKRQTIYLNDPSLFKITNYESVLRDIMVLDRYKPDLVILDEAQRIKNFTTKTADAVKQIPRKHALILTGTPLENKLEDVYSLIQFLDPRMLSPLWKFAADHFMLSRDKKGKILGYRNLEKLHEKLKSIVIRRRKEEVLLQLPDEIINSYYIDLDEKQQKIHNGYLQSLLPLLNKKILTPMDLRRIQELLLCMRRVCDSTYLIDRKTNISPKLKELEGILEELVIQNGRKVVIFSEWTSMTFLIAKHLSDVSIPFVELSGNIPVNKRQALIDEFTINPDCKVFLSTDAGGTGLNLQAADCVINFELPWNPARLNQRVGRVNRIGQKSRTVNVINLIAKNSIEEKILAGIQLKTDLFKGVFDGESDVVEFSSEKRTELMNRLRQMIEEEPAQQVSESKPAEEIPEDTPHYLNPKVLNNNNNEVVCEVYDKEEISDEKLEAAKENAEETSGKEKITELKAPGKIEAVLNSGLQFIGGLLEMVTGKKFEPFGNDQKMIQIDKNTGEVIFRFKLPGF